MGPLRPIFINEPDHSAALGGARARRTYFGEKRPEFAGNMRRYVEYIRGKRRDADPCADQFAEEARNASGMFNLEEGTALEVVRPRRSGDHRCAAPGSLRDPGDPRRRDRGLFASASRGTARTTARSREFAIPCGSKRVSDSCAATAFDLAARMSTIPWVRVRGDGLRSSSFDDVLVVERVFLLYDVNRLNARRNHPFDGGIRHQGPPRTSPNASSCWGSRLLMTQTLGNAHLAAYRGDTSANSC